MSPLGRGAGPDGVPTDIPPHVADIIRSLHPDLKRSVRSAVRAIAADRTCGEPLRQELEGLWKYRVRRFRIVYAINRRAWAVCVMAVGHRRNVYEGMPGELGESR